MVLISGCIFSVVFSPSLVASDPPTPPPTPRRGRSRAPGTRRGGNGTVSDTQGCGDPRAPTVLSPFQAPRARGSTVVSSLAGRIGFLFYYEFLRGCLRGAPLRAAAALQFCPVAARGRASHASPSSAVSLLCSTTATGSADFPSFPLSLC